MPLTIGTGHPDPPDMREGVLSGGKEPRAPLAHAPLALRLFVVTLVVRRTGVAAATGAACTRACRRPFRRYIFVLLT